MQGSSSAVERRSYKPEVAGAAPACPTIADVAQLVEQRFRKSQVVGSSLTVGLQCQHSSVGRAGVL